MLILIYLFLKNLNNPPTLYFDESSKKYQLRLQVMPEGYPEGDAEADALALNQALEALILKSPEQYLWVLKYYRTVAPEDQNLY